MRLQGKTAFITGGNSGIGLAAARLFIAEGARVAITGRNRKTLDEAAAALGDGALALQADVTDVSSLEKAAAAAANAFGGLDIVFANAGVAGLTPLGATTPEQFDSLLRTNVSGVFFTVQAALPHLKDGGAVVLNGSVHQSLGMPGWAAYAASKGAVRSLARVLAAELAPRRIRVNQVTPGATRTPIWSPFAPDAARLAALEEGIAANTPLGRIGEAEEVARAVLFLASDESSNITAAEIPVDGGTTGAPAAKIVRR